MFWTWECDHNKFEILREEFGNGELSTDSIDKKFIITTNSIVKDFIDYIVNRNKKINV